jgi:hypothetical protein
MVTIDCISFPKFWSMQNIVKISYGRCISGAGPPAAFCRAQIGLIEATGATAVLLLEQALAAGHTVKALARNPPALKSQAKLTVDQGDVENQAAQSH